jgi:UDP-glucuronate 4-epimerase
VNVLVTGASGLVGMAVRARLDELGHTVVATDQTQFGRDDPTLRTLSLLNVDGLHALAAAQPLDGIVHCAAVSGPMMLKGRPLEIVATNVIGTANVLDAARRTGVRRVVFCSSISVYGNVGTAEITEDTPLRPTSVYAATKVAGEQLVQAFAEEYGGDGVSLRIARIYGPYRRGDCLIRDMVAAAARGEEVVIPCTPGFSYNYVWAGDVAAAVVKALNTDRLPSRVYNVGSGETTTMPETVKTARRVLPGLRAKMVPGVDDVPDVQNRFDVGRIAAELGFHPEFDLARGIAAYAAAFA